MHCYIGEEAVAVGVCAALEAGDQIISTHRGHGHCIAKGADLNRMMAELYGRETGYCKGKGGSMHIADFDIGMLGANGIVAGGISIVTGAGLAAQMDGKGRRRGLLLRRRRLQCGAVPRVPQHRGDLEAADALRLREQHVCGADRGSRRRMPCRDVAGRAAGYGIPGIVVDGNDIFAVYQAAARAVERAHGLARDRR